MTTRQKIAKIEKLSDFDEEYVYDISVKGNDKYFFANNILVHNTDSIYFSAIDSLKELDFDITKESIVELYDTIGESVNQTFPSFMEKTFNCPLENGAIIAAGRELVASKGLFIKKKRYAVMVYDKEGTRLDKDNKPGKIKAMGLDTKRTDTPKNIQDFLEEILMLVLTGSSEQEVLDYIREYRVNSFRKLNPWEMGTPKGVSGLDGYTKGHGKMQINTGKKTSMPGHIKAAMNWNTLKKVHNDRFSMDIMDGFKVIVCKLKNNPLGMDSVAYPKDETNLPDWFKELPFDTMKMEETIFDKKVSNLIGVLRWGLDTTKALTDYRMLFRKKSN